MKNFDYKKILHRITRTLRYGEVVRPQRDWLLIIGIGSILFLASAGWSYSVFHRVSVGESLESPSITANGINLSSLEAVKTIFDARAAERAHYQNDYRFVDPSR